MKERVFFLPSTENDDDQEVAARLSRLISSEGLLAFVHERDYVAIKTHFGEEGTDGYVRPVYLKALGELVASSGGKPFLTETATLYRHRRSNAVDHLILAEQHGFGCRETGMPIVMADGLLGDEEVTVEVPGVHASRVQVASLFARVQGLVLVSHLTGHLIAGLGAALKNLGMGCTGRKGKLVQHSTTRPSIKPSECTGCGECALYCPEDAIEVDDQVATVDQSRCVGCGECHAVCRFDAVSLSWSATSRGLQERMVEHAFGVVKCVGSRALYINSLKRITRACDCMHSERILPDIGILVARDPVALDAASLDLVERRAHRRLQDLAYPVSGRIQLEHARAIGFGTTEYELVELK